MLTVIRPGMLTTVQDLGRWGYQRAGIPVAGPMDIYSHRLANAVVGNDETAAALEITLVGPELQARMAVTCAITGARFQVFVNDAPVPLDAPVDIPSGGRLRFGARIAGARASLAVRGGLAVPAVYGSRATSISSGIGPFGGRALRAGDELPVGAGRPRRPAAARGTALRLPQGGASLRVIQGPQAGMFEDGALRALYGSRFVVTPASNRMGYRLDGPPLNHSGGTEILSDATPVGSLQVPASGRPILLMADRQTTGGYPKIATVITADLPLAGQLAPGDWIELRQVSRPDAVDALRRQAARLESRA